jgi:D-lactate dehydrogenase
MKVVAYSVREFEKEFVARANHKQHDITLISNSLNLETASYAQGKEAVVVSSQDDLTEEVIDKLADLGIKYITTRSVSTDHIDRLAAGRRNIKLANVPSYSSAAVSEYTIMLALSLGKRIIPTANSSKEFDFRIDQHIGFNFRGKTIGIIGLGAIGKATALVFKIMGCKILGHDVIEDPKLDGIEQVSFEELLEQSDIISLHIPLNSVTKHIINMQSISKMKTGVMLINTSRGGLINSADLLRGLHSGKIGWLGLDGYEFEQGMFYSDHSHDLVKDPIMKELLSFPNVIISPHQAFLTKETLQEIANLVIQNLDNWEAGKCSGKACICADGCSKR